MGKHQESSSPAGCEPDVRLAEAAQANLTGSALVLPGSRQRQSEEAHSGARHANESAASDALIRAELAKDLAEESHYNAPLIGQDRQWLLQIVEACLRDIPPQNS